MIGRRIAQYTILDRLGAGGMGEVFLAEDTRLQRQVALKILHTNQPRELRRLHEEARATSALQHPAVAHIYEIAEVEGLSFLVMEYVRGSSLEKLIDDGKVDVPTAVDIAAQIADALVEAQEKGITHRDLKPANIMITERGSAKILDFGLARVHRTTDSGPRLTAPGVIVGTLDYMSPEQALASDVDIRSDIFSLGVMLYEMVTGTRPFSGKGAAETMNRLLHFEPEPPHSINPEVSAELSRIIARCTSKLPSERYQSAGDLLADLNILRHRGPGTSGEMLPPAAPPKRRLFFALAISTVVIAAAIFTAWQIIGNSRDPISSLAVLPFTCSTSQPAANQIADSLTEGLINRISKLPSLSVVSRPTVFRYKGTDVSPRDIGEKLHVGAVLTGNVEVQGELITVQTELIATTRDAQIWGKRFEGRSSDLVEMQREIAETVARHLTSDLTQDDRARMNRGGTLNPEAFDLYVEGRSFLEQRKTARAIAALEKTVERDPQYAAAWAALAEAYIIPAARKRGAAADELYTKATRAAQRALALDPSLVEVHTALADLQYTHQWNWDAADAQFRRAIAIDPSYATAHHWYALFLAYTGRGGEAIPHIRRARELEPASTIIRLSEARVYYYARQYSKAIETSKQNLERVPSAPAPWMFIALAAAQMRDYATWARAREEQSTALNNPDYAEAIREGFANGGYREANRRYLAVLEKRKARGEDVDPHSYYETCLRLGDYDQALRWAERLVELRSQHAFRIVADPMSDPLRDHPRFIALVERMRLPRRAPLPAQTASVPARTSVN